MVDEKDELPDLNEDLTEDGISDDLFASDSDDDFFSETGEADDLLDADFGDAEEELSIEEEESFEEVAEDDDDFFSSEPGDDLSLDVEVEEEPEADLPEPEEEFPDPEEDVESAPEEESLVGGILGDEGEESMSPLAGEVKGEDVTGDTEEEAPKKKKTSPLLVLLLLLAVGYGAYAYIIPMYFPELLSSSQTAAPVQAPAPKRIAVKQPQKQEAPKPEPAKEPKVAEKVVKAEAVEVIEDEALEPVKRDSMPARPAPVEEEAKAEVVAEPEKTSLIPTEKIRVAKANLPVEGAQGFFVQAGAFIFKSNVKGPVAKIKEAGYTPRIETASKSVGMHRLTVNEWDNFEDTNTAALELREQGYRGAKVLPLKDDKFTVLIGSYYYKHLAVEEGIILDVKGFDSKIDKKPVQMKVYHILLGPYATAEEAVKVESVLKGKGLETAVLKNN